MVDMDPRGRTRGDHLELARLRLSSRSHNALERAGLRTVGDLLRKTPQELLHLKAFGKAALEDVRRALRSRGLRLRINGER